MQEIYNNSNRWYQMDIIKHTIFTDYIKLLLVFILPSLSIHFLILLTIPDIITQDGRTVIFIFTLILGILLIITYFLKVMIPSIMSRISDKEYLVEYETNLLNVSEEEQKNITIENNTNIEKLHKKTGMSHTEAYIIYIKANREKLKKRIEMLQLPEKTRKTYND